MVNLYSSFFSYSCYGSAPIFFLKDLVFQSIKGTNSVFRQANNHNYVKIVYRLSEAGFYTRFDDQKLYESKRFIIVRCP